jgi:hypothetical protein
MSKDFENLILEGIEDAIMAEQHRQKAAELEHELDSMDPYGPDRDRTVLSMLLTQGLANLYDKRATNRIGPKVRGVEKHPLLTGESLPPAE